MVNKDDLTIDQKAVLLSLASLNKKYSRSRIYFEKFLFLLTKSLPDLLEDLNNTFEAYKMGPYNEYADEIIEGLRDLHLLEPDNQLSEEGEMVVQELRNDKESQPILNKIHELKEILDDINVDDILFLTYKLYPDYASQSVITDKVRSDKLEAYKIDLSNLREGQILSVKSDKGNSIKVKREGNRLVILEG